MIQYVTAALLKSKVHAHDVFPYERLLRSNTNTNTILTINTQIWTSPWWHDAADRVPTVTMRGSMSGGSVPSNQWPAPGTPSTLRSGDPALSRWWLRRDTYRLYLLFWVARGKVICCDGGGVCVVSLCTPHRNKVNHSPHAIATISSPPSSWHQQRIIDCSGGEHREHGHGSRSRDPGHWETRYNYRCKRLIGEVVQSRRRPLLGPKQKS